MTFADFPKKVAEKFGSFACTTFLTPRVLNGTIKGESVYRQDRRFKTYEETLEQIERFIIFYNSRRPHYSIGLQTPNDAHEQTGEQKKMWKTKNYQKNDQSLQNNA